MRPPTRVILGEDSLIFREGIKELLEQDPRIELLEVCDDQPSVMRAVERRRPDVVITDIRMPPSMTSEGIQIANALRETHTDIGVLVLSQYADAAYVIELFEHGSGRRGYLLKSGIGSADELANAVTTIAEGGSVVDPHVVEALVAARHDQSGPLSALTSREIEVLALVAEGRSNRSIAEDLVITTRAVEHHISAIFTKLDLGDEAQVHRRVRAALVYLSAQQSLGSPPLDGA
jgi:DNA-binding NarL/FixJ family response regulator